MDDINNSRFKLLSKEALYQGFFRLERYRIKYKQFNGSWSDEFDREIFERGNAAAALLLDPKRDLLVMVEQFRPGAIASEENPWLLELVAGIIESHEAPEDVIPREGLEEAGCEVTRLHKICEYLVSPGGTTERIWLYLGEVNAENLPEYAGLEEEQEDIKVHQISVNEAFEMLENGKVNNAMTLIALQWLKLNWHKKDAFWR